MKMILPELSKAKIAKAETQLQAGRRYANGEDTLTDYVAAARCYEKAARLGYCRGQYELAKCYFRGAGVPQDHNRAKELLRSAAMEYLPAFRMLRQYYFDEGVRLQPDFSKFPGLQVKAAKGQAAACTAMGNCYFAGSVGYRDYTAAVHWYRKAADKGDPEAQFCLGFAYMVGAGTAQDKASGFAWFQKAARQDFVPAIHNLTVCYTHGYGTEHNPLGAIEEQDRLKDIAVGSTEPNRFYSPQDLWSDRKTDTLTDILYPETNN